MIIGWCGHACVYIKKSDGYTIVIDPHDGISIGLKRPNIKADLVLVTHDHFDHNAVNTVKKDTTRVLKEYIGLAELDGIIVEGYETYHDKYKGKRRGINTVYKVVVEGYSIVHLGDLGDYPPNEVKDKIKNADLLAIPVGGVYTIYPDEAWKLVEELEPRNILPIHYWVKGLILPLYRLEDFLVHVKKYHVIRLDSSEFNLEDYDKNVIIPVY